MTLPGHQASRPISQPYTALIAPRTELASCVRAYISRSTIACTLEPHEMLNRFPARPLCVIGWMIQGDWDELLGEGQSADRSPPTQVWFSGPFTSPSFTVNKGELQVFMLVLMPDALQAITGIDIEKYMNHGCALAKVFDSAWQTMAHQVLHAKDDATRVQLIEKFLLPRWQRARNGNFVKGKLLDWINGLAIRAAACGTGKSLRQIERRIKAWTGMPLRQLRGMGRLEASLLQSRTEDFGSKFCWTEFAVKNGFTDQAHLCREARRMSGMSPAQLVRSLDEDESYWIYRIWQ
jgi:AraC-like DNA-binding protein